MAVIAPPAAGALAGVICSMLALMLANKLRDKPSFQIAWPSTKTKRYIVLLSGLCGGIYCLLLSSQNLTLPQLIMLVFLFFTSLIIAVVDILTRIIPNQLVAILLLGAVIAYIAHALNEDIGRLLLGFGVTFAAFALPFYFSSAIGGGDVKLAAVIGLWVGFPDVAFALLIMACGILIYALYLKLFRSGGLKSEIALGPFLTLGLIVTITLKILI